MILLNCFGVGLEIPSPPTLKNFEGYINKWSETQLNSQCKRDDHLLLWMWKNVQHWKKYLLRRKVIISQQVFIPNIYKPFQASWRLQRRIKEHLFNFQGKDCQSFFHFKYFPTSFSIYLTLFPYWWGWFLSYIHKNLSNYLILSMASTLFLSPIWSYCVDLLFWTEIGDKKELKLSQKVLKVNMILLKYWLGG